MIRLILVTCRAVRAIQREEATGQISVCRITTYFVAACCSISSCISENPCGCAGKVSCTNVVSAISTSVGPSISRIEVHFRKRKEGNKSGRSVRKELLSSKLRLVSIEAKIRKPEKRACVRAYCKYPICHAAAVSCWPRTMESVLRTDSRTFSTTPRGMLCSLS